jgi:HSP20 family protein
MRSLTPWRSTLHSEIDDIFDRFFRGDPGWPPREIARLATPALESFLRDDQLVIRVDLPGIDPDGIDLTVESNRLTVRGERKDVNEDKNRLYKGVTYGRFERSLALPAGLDPETVKATYRDGVLEIAMATPKALATKKVPIQVH